MEAFLQNIANNSEWGKLYNIEIIYYNSNQLFSSKNGNAPTDFDNKSFGTGAGWTNPVINKKIIAIAIGGGGGGGTGYRTSAGGGGGGGGGAGEITYAEFFNPRNLYINIGLGGIGGTPDDNTGANGNNGGNTFVRDMRYFQYETGHSGDPAYNPFNKNGILGNSFLVAFGGSGGLKGNSATGGTAGYCLKNSFGQNNTAGNGGSPNTAGSSSNLGSLLVHLNNNLNLYYGFQIPDNMSFPTIGATGGSAGTGGGGGAGANGLFGFGGNGGTYSSYPGTDATDADAYSFGAGGGGSHGDDGTDTGIGNLTKGGDGACGCVILIY
jgi:hypothetical protein